MVAVSLIPVVVSLTPVVVAGATVQVPGATVAGDVALRIGRAASQLHPVSNGGFFVVRRSIPSTVVPASGDIQQTLMLVLKRAFNRSGISGFIAPNAQ